MVRVLYVGDPHATASELRDMDGLLTCIHDAVKKHRPDKVVFLGDEFHHHGVVHLEVMHWWTEAVKGLVRLMSTHAVPPHTDWLVGMMVGNHDKPESRAPGVHALESFSWLPGVKVIDAPEPLFEGILAVPHMDTWEEFRRACDSKYAVVVCHNTFDGAQMENGFYAPEGFNVETLPPGLFLSGHIHRPQEFGKVWYLGAPRWRTASDANTERALWCVTHGDDGRVVERIPVDTGPYCRRIINIEETEEMGVAYERYDTKKDDVRVTITGPDWFLKATVPVREAQGFKVRTVKTGTAAVARVKESEGVSTAFRKFTSAYEPKHGTSPAILQSMAAERLANA